MTSNWSNFLIAETSAAAALAGLIFVAVSINLRKILEYEGVASRAAEALALLIGVLFVGTFGLVPNQPEKLWGGEILTVGGVLFVATMIVHLRMLGRKRPWWWLASRAFLCHCATLSFCIAGILTILGHPDGVYWLVPGCIFSFGASMSTAWVLLVEILR